MTPTREEREDAAREYARHHKECTCKGEDLDWSLIDPHVAGQIVGEQRMKEAMDVLVGATQYIENSLRFVVPAKSKTEMANFLREALAKVEGLGVKG